MSKTSDEIGIRDCFVQHLDSGERIQAHLLVTEEAWRIKREFTDAAFPTVEPIDYAAIQTRLKKYLDLTAPLLELIALGCFGGDQKMASSWTGIIEFISEYPRSLCQDNTNLKRLRAYPTLLLAYAGGVAAIAGNNHEVLAALLYRTRIMNIRTDEENALAQNLYPDEIIESRFAQGILSEEPEPRDLNGHLYRVIRPALQHLIPSERRYQEVFDRFEAYLALAHADIKYQAQNKSIRWVPLENFHRHRNNQPSVWETIKAEADFEGEDWPPLRAGLFRGSSEYFNLLKSGIDQLVSQSGLY